MKIFSIAILRTSFSMIFELSNDKSFAEGTAVPSAYAFLENVSVAIRSATRIKKVFVVFIIIQVPMTNRNLRITQTIKKS